MTAATPTLDLARARVAWWLRQGLESDDDLTPKDILVRHGWMYAGKTCAPHIACHSRLDGVGREDVDGMVPGGSAMDVSTVRGCGMVVPFQDAGLALHMGRMEFAKRLSAAERRLGFDGSSLGPLEGAVVDALGDTALTPQQLKSALPDGLIVSFGEAGKKLGESSSLPLALRSLEAAGRVRRVTADGRLDGTRYVYELAPENPFEAADMPDDDDAVLAQLAARFFSWAAPATLDEFAWWAGLPKGRSKKAIAAAGLQEVEIEGLGTAYLPADELETVLALDPESVSSVRFLPLRDNYLYFRRQSEVFTDEDPNEIQVLTTQMKPVSLARSGSVFSQTIFHGGRLIGLWEHDPSGAEGPEVETRLFFDLGTRVEADVEQARVELEEFLVAELGNPSTWPMDSDARRAKRLAAFRAL